jgi:hypothetical protein
MCQADHHLSTIGTLGSPPYSTGQPNFSGEALLGMGSRDPPHPTAADRSHQSADQLCGGGGHCHPDWSRRPRDQVQQVSRTPRRKVCCPFSRCNTRRREAERDAPIDRRCNPQEAQLHNNRQAPKHIALGRCDARSKAAARPGPNRPRSGPDRRRQQPCREAADATCRTAQPSALSSRGAPPGPQQLRRRSHANAPRPASARLELSAHAFTASSPSSTFGGRGCRHRGEASGSGGGVAG